MRCVGHQHVADAAVAIVERYLESDPLPAQGAFHPRRALPCRLGRQHVVRSLPDHGVAVDPHGRFVGAVGEEVAALLVEVGDQCRHVVGIDADVALRADQRLLGALLLGDVLVGVDEPASRHRVAQHFQHRTVGAVALVAVGLAASDVLDQLLDMLLRIAGTVLAVVGVVAEHLLHRRADADQVVGEAEDLQVALIPHHQVEVLVDHPDTLVDVLDGRLEQGAVELQHLGRLVDDRDNVGDADAAALERRVDHDSR